MRHWMGAAIAASMSLIFLSGTTVTAQSDPPARVGRISFITGTVSYDDREEGEERHWSPALLNHPFTTGSALWTEPNGRAEVDVAGTRLRLQGATELEADVLDDEQLRLRLPQGRLDVRSSDIASGRPPEILTPRGTVRLVQDGDYVIEAGTADDPTRIGVRSGLAQFVDANGSVLEVKPGETGVATGTQPVVFAVEHVTPPPMPAEWAARDRRVTVYRPTSYVEPAVTGYEDLDAYGDWSDTSDYGQVWVPRHVAPGWAPYRHGRWVWVRPWGWTWVDSAPWGFAPFHYGRWVHLHRRWCWVPPARRTRPVYAPAIVGFMGGAGARPTVGWFPLGPREVYVPPYSRNRTYIRNINVTNVRDVTVIDRRIDDVERHRHRRDDRHDHDRRDHDRWTYANQRHATVVPVDAFRRSRPVGRSALPVERERLARAEVASAPPDDIGRPERKERPGAPGPAARRTQERKAVVPDRKPDPPSDKVTPPPKGATPPGKGPGTPQRPEERAKPPSPAGKDQLPAPRAAPKAPERIAPSSGNDERKARSAPRDDARSKTAPRAPERIAPSGGSDERKARPTPRSNPPKVAPSAAPKPQGTRSRPAHKLPQRVAPSTSTPRATAPRTTAPRASPQRPAKPRARTPSRPPAKARSAPAPRPQRAPAGRERGR